MESFSLLKLIDDVGEDRCFGIEYLLSSVWSLRKCRKSRKEIELNFEL